MDKYLSYYTNFKKYNYLLILLTQNHISKKYRGSVLGIFWSLLNPLLQMIVLTLIFSSFFGNQISNFPLYMISARLVFEFFSTATNGTMKSIVDSSDLIKKVYIPKYLITSSKVLAEFIIFLISLIDLLIVIFITGADININFIYVPLYLLLLFIFTTGVSLVLSTITIFFRDIEHLYSVFVMTLMYFSAIFYPAEIVPEKYRFILEMNPLYQFISGFRQIVYYGQPIELYNLLYCIVAGIVSLSIGLFVFEKNQHKFILHL
ncbi:ABC-2 type transport system permease protein/lipopolysaccharide transport system permease protein [Paenibacillus polysaccharolyticus]|uniref:Transport permease protein n=1 Tax=Paenibacillus polysaccharolyticus TaxID=582692 RepID=A0A1G5K7T0_9BACL|nr:ABC transporter permease [Paenibacillus polysaccharolyticus]SCY96665.1 ABC-2 type transport system permease protein/lipopolysaccharide transport system permease protein [Paenibacillus polysaccharolyticus]